MTCGKLCVMRRERRGVLHLNKYSPPKANWFGGGEKGEYKRKEKEKNRDKKNNGKEREPAVL